MKAFVFPGQGAQFVGMGKDLYENSALAKELFEKANDILGYRITDIMFNGTDEDLRQTKVIVVAVHHALLTSGLPVSEVDIVCTLPLTEYYDRNNQPNTENIERKKANFRKKITLNGGDTFTIKDVKVMPESIPAGYEVLQELDELDSLLIIDLGGTTLDISQVMGKLSGISKIYGDSSLGVSLVTSAVKDALSLARTS